MVADDEVSLTLSFEQITGFLLKLTVGTLGFALTTTFVLVEVDVHPKEFETVTEIFKLFFTTIDTVRSPVDQRLLEVEDDVKITESPAQKVVAPDAVTTGVAGTGFTEISVSTETAEHPDALVTRTEYLPATFAEYC